MWVNGEKYVFSEDVINAGDSLFKCFLMIRDTVTSDDNSRGLREILQCFDEAWTKYEQYYVYELMVIETDARRFIFEAMKIEEQMQEMEREIECRGRDVYTDESYNLKRQELVTVMAQVNTICNTNGKGREDLT